MTTKAAKPPRQPKKTIEKVASKSDVGEHLAIALVSGLICFQVRHSSPAGGSKPSFKGARRPLPQERGLCDGIALWRAALTAN